MNNITDFYYCEIEEQPIKFKVIKYDIDTIAERIIVNYNKEIFNTAKTKVLKVIKKSYKVVDIKAVLDAEGEVITEEDLQFTNWVNYMPENMTMEQVFHGNTIPKILRINGHEFSEPME